MEKLEFLYKSLDDTQSTIRAIDVKAGFMFVLMFFPVAGLESIINIASCLIEKSGVYLVLLISVLSLWITSLYMLFKTVLSISNPEAYIDGGSKPKGIFFSPKLFDLSFFDYLFNFPIKSNKTFEEYKKGIPSDKEAIVEELAFEKMKLSYIRDIKIHRLSLCMKSSLGWLFLGCVTWLVSIIHAGCSNA